MRISDWSSDVCSSDLFDSAQVALEDLQARYDHVPPEEAGLIVALGGDGFVLQTLRRFIDRKVSVFGMNRGSVGFLMNDYNATDLAERLARAEPVTLHPLVMDAVTVHGESRQSFAFNEVSLLRQPYQAAH